MNPNNLFEYGVQGEHSDIRAHVAVLARRVYVYRTEVGKALVESGLYPLRPAFQPGVVGMTALGALVPVGDFPDLRVLSLRRWPIWDHWPETLSTTDKGKRAIQVVIAALQRGRFPVWVATKETDRKDLQIQGTDIVVHANQRIQVKCDYRGGEGHPRCTGNLFLQVAERNPLGHY